MPKEPTKPEPPDAVRVAGEDVFGNRVPAPDAIPASPRPSRASGISLAPTPPPALNPSGGTTSPPPVDDGPRYRPSELRQEVERAYEQTMPPVSSPITDPAHAATPATEPSPTHSHNAGSHGPAKPITWEDLAVGGFSTFIAIPLCDASWHAIVVEQEAVARGLIGLAIGLPIGFAGISFHWWKDRTPKFRDWIVRQAKWWCPVALVLVLIYVAGPEAYRRATKPVAVAGSIGTMPIGTAPLDDAVAQANKKAIAERDEAIQSAARMAKERDDAVRQREAALAQAGRVQDMGSYPKQNETGPIKWNDPAAVQLFVIGMDTSGYEVYGALFWGESTESVSITEAYAISGLTGHKQDLKANVTNKGYFPVDKVDIPPGAPVHLDLVWNPPIPIKDFLSQWGKFHLVIVYNGVKFERDFDEALVRKKLQENAPGMFGPQMTPRDDK